MLTVHNKPRESAHQKASLYAERLCRRGQGLDSGPAVGDTVRIFVGRLVVLGDEVVLGDGVGTDNDIKAPCHRRNSGVKLMARVRVRCPCSASAPLHPTGYRDTARHVTYVHVVAIV